MTEKARCALSAKDVPFQMVQMSMTNKAQWHLDLGGQIPFLEFPNGKIIQDANLIMEFASTFAGAKRGIRLWPHEGKPGDEKSNLRTTELKDQQAEFEKLLPKIMPAIFTSYRN